MAPWTPQNLANLHAWYKAETIALADGANVNAWADSGAGGRNLSPASTGRPTYETAEINALPVVRFAAAVTNDHLQSTSFALPVPFSIALLGRFPDGSDLFDAQGTGNDAFLYRSGNNLIINSSIDQTVGSIADTNPHVVTALYNGATSRGSVDGTASAAVDPGTISANRTSIFFGRNALGTADQQVDLGEIVVGVGAWSDAARQMVEGYLAWKWGLQANLPGGHLYQSLAPQAGSKSGLRYPLGTGLRQRTLR